MKMIIVGGGQKLYYLYRNFAARGYRVAIINRDREQCEELSMFLKAPVFCGEGSDPSVLEQAGAMDCDAVLAITPWDFENLITCQLATHLFHTPRVIALANDPDNVPLFEKLGVSSFSSTRIIVSIIEERTSFDKILNMLPLGEGRINVTELVAEEGSLAIGKRIMNLGLPEGALISAVIRGETILIPNGECCILPNDKLILISNPENHGPALKKIMGNKPGELY